MKRTLVRVEINCYPTCDDFKSSDSPKRADNYDLRLRKLTRVSERFWVLIN